jgi:hypothetical protein
MFVLNQNLFDNSFLLNIKTLNCLLYGLNILLIMQILWWLSISLNSKPHLLIHWNLLKLKLIVVTNNEITIIGSNLLSQLPCIEVVELVTWLINITIFRCWNLLLVLVGQLSLCIVHFALEFWSSCVVLWIRRDLEPIVVYIYCFLRSLMHKVALIMHLRVLILMKLQFSWLFLRSWKLMKLTLVSKIRKLI